MQANRASVNLSCRVTSLSLANLSSLVIKLQDPFIVQVSCSTFAAGDSLSPLMARYEKEVQQTWEQVQKQLNVSKSLLDGQPMRWGQYFHPWL
ncbi:hypothetical protein RRG08_025020 [Elysia crispata]|uniref:Uncharacterized protein n=1 Tax=Elysia crispata TaxID=231223 RepID=A0AAE1ANK3_9GAST|nr:hypothetical protein RRG08_025020 [Elysia crispata]